ncbi:MAG: aspartate 1-decarboxylase [Candidatus Marinimicrobia bacterium]|nr:aspartate 1-decarboxylase [Candidatus Neomarinimicrobiota bacterium]
MRRRILHAKIHRATVSDANLHYTGSISLPEDLMQAADILEYEQVQVENINNGARFETYVIRGEKGSRNITLNGAAARLAQIGDRIIIMSYVDLDQKEIAGHRPHILVLNENNSIVNRIGE